MIVLGLYVFLGEFNNVFCAVFRARQRMEYEAYLRAGQAALMLAAVAVVLWKFPSVLMISWAYAGSALVAVVITGILGSGSYWRLHFQLKWHEWKHFLRIALPLGVAGVVMIAYGNVDSVMLGYWGKVTETGLYNAASRINHFFLLPMPLMQIAMLPAFASMANAVDETFRARWNRWTGGMITFGMLLTMLVLVTAEPMVQIFFGAEFRPAGPALRILTLGAALMYTYIPCYHALITFNKTSKVLWAAIAAGIVNIGINLWFIPTYGMYAACWAMVATNLVSLVTLVTFVATSTPLKPVNRVTCSALLSSTVAAVLGYLAMRMIHSIWWVAAPLGCVVFAATLVTMRKASGALLARSALS